MESQSEPGGAARKSEIRMPKSETNPNATIRKSETALPCDSRGLLNVWHGRPARVFAAKTWAGRPCHVGFRICPHQNSKRSCPTPRFVNQTPHAACAAKT